ncbi:MAG: hypothetical protein ACYS3N_24485 [Planctomycetota bacterium]
MKISICNIWSISNAGRSGLKWRDTIHVSRFTKAISTFVEIALQIAPFLTNKPNFLDNQMNVSSFITMNYEQQTMNYEIKNKPNSNPIQSQYKPNTKPIQTQFKPKQTQFQMKNAVALNDKHPAGCREVYDKPVNMHPFSVVFRYSNMYIYFFQLYCKHIKQLN